MLLITTLPALLGTKQQNCKKSTHLKCLLIEQKNSWKKAAPGIFPLHSTLGIHVQSPVSILNPTRVIFSFSAELVVQLHTAVLMRNHRQNWGGQQWYHTQSFILKYSYVWMGRNKNIPTKDNYLSGTEFLFITCEHCATAVTNMLHEKLKVHTSLYLQII